MLFQHRMEGVPTSTTPHNNLARPPRARVLHPSDIVHCSECCRLSGYTRPRTPRPTLFLGLTSPEVLIQHLDKTVSALARKPASKILVTEDRPGPRTGAGSSQPANNKLLHLRHFRCPLMHFVRA